NLAVRDERVVRSSLPRQRTGDQCRRARGALFVLRAFDDLASALRVLDRALRIAVRQLELDVRDVEEGDRAGDLVTKRLVIREPLIEVPLAEGRVFSPAVDDAGNDTALGEQLVELRNLRDVERGRDPFYRFDVLAAEKRDPRLLAHGVHGPRRIVQR